MADYITAFQSVVAAITSNDLADEGTAEATEVDNQTPGEIGAWIMVKVNDGAGAHADGWSLYLRASLDDGTTDSDAKTWWIGSGPSPNSGTITRLFRVDRLPDRYTTGVYNQTAATADFTVQVMPDHIES